MYPKNYESVYKDYYISSLTLRESKKLLKLHRISSKLINGTGENGKITLEDMKKVLGNIIAENVYEMRIIYNSFTTKIILENGESIWLRYVNRIPDSYYYYPITFQKIGDNIYECEYNGHQIVQLNIVNGNFTNNNSSIGRDDFYKEANIVLKHMNQK